MIRFIRLAFWRLFRVIQVTVVTPVLIGGTLVYAALGAMVGALVAFPFAYAILRTEPGTNPWENAIYIPFMIAGAIVGAAGWIDRSGAASFFGSWRGDSHGSARFAGKKELRDLERANGLLIGRNPDTGKLLSYDGPAHLLTLAPTRAGKGVGTVIPNLLLAERSVLVIDPKGENARIAGAARERFGTVHVLDPFGVSGRPSAAYNPLDRLSADSPDLSEDATSLADALVVDPAHQTGDAHWNEEAKALIGGLIMFCVAHEEPTRRNLGAVREYLTLPPDRMADLVKLMQDSDVADGLVARAANRFAGKADREAASVLSNAQRHTHFLDSPRIAKAMARSDFQFADLRHRITSVFLVLPPNRLDAYSRWLRLLVSQALHDIARDAETPLGPQIAAQPPVERLKAPTLFLLDEFAALGRLEAVERAMGLMAGYGLQLWPILQDMSQLRDLYGQRASTFVANAGVQQVFGVNDYETAKWLSQMMGQGTIGYQTESHKPGDMPTTGTSITGRDLLTPDEIMQLPPELQLLRVQGQPTAIAGKLRYYADREFEGLFVPENR
ncbi:type IV secretory system conjugative DNA transfer family protein [Mesobacterium sp. TK19101]|uniref:Type IV secretory system conjugative DNA transfer family protein n=1 Tax=Mesobacterium hydrothermale TaxID=3111907 RepID=A0ABU6HMY4_9RHOB|nr:type IV secretory system conjugative DNA transfer family protein [Mesobacterium sp. TK19101]MEC3863289.1 type IV secretory system conjugative DNA transfer family protein [Mesobacterium sp. TK19101]